MTYIFFLGSHPSISVAEILAYFRRKNLVISKPILLTPEILQIETSANLTIVDVMRELGGTIKIGVLVAELPGDVETSAPLIMKELLSLAVDRLHFGFSAYGVRISKNLGLKIKKEIIAQGKMARWVVSREPDLSSVVIEQNKLLTHGFDFSFIKAAKKIYLAKTLAVQPFKELSKRDYGRPGRDDHSGMLPPKLAQMMLNLGLVTEDKNLLDPFCGSGTVLSEAILLGVKNIFGSDISAKAVADTLANLEWIDKEGAVKGKDQRVAQISATELSSHFRENSIDAIVTEPFLGPQRGDYDVRQVIAELEDLYAKAISEFGKVLKAGGRAVMIWPVIKTKNDRIFMSAKIAGNLKMIKPLPLELMKELKLTNRETLLYGRPDQRVWREIVILEK
jgi:tRNA G10  N-methylase Trm11